MHGLPNSADSSHQQPSQTAGKRRILAGVFWLTVLAAASVAGAAATVASGNGADFMDSPGLAPSLIVLTVLCGLAGGFAPAGWPYWGLVPVVPYFVAMFTHTSPPDPAAFMPAAQFHPFLLFFAMLPPWVAGAAVGYARKKG